MFWEYQETNKATTKCWQKARITLQRQLLEIPIFGLKTDQAKKSEKAASKFYFQETFRAFIFTTGYTMENAAKSIQLRLTWRWILMLKTKVQNGWKITGF